MHASRAAKRRSSATVTARRSNRLIVGRVEAGVLAEADRGEVGIDDRVPVRAELVECARRWAANMADRASTLDRRLMFSLLFFPEREILATPAEVGLPFEDVAIETEDGEPPPGRPSLLAGRHAKAG